MNMIARLLQLTLVALTALRTRANAALFGVHQSGMYWGAHMDTSGSSSNDKFDLFPTFQQATGSLSYDPVTGQSLFELVEPHAIAYGPMCSNSHGFAPQVLFNVSDIMLDRPDLGTVVSGKISAFALYDSEIYFLHYGSYLTEEQEIFHIFQIRKFLSCEACKKDPYLEEGSSNSAFSLTYSVNCSVLVSEALRFSSEEDPDILRYEFEGGKSLKVAKQAGMEELKFFFQIGKIELSDEGIGLQMILYKASSTSSSTEVIHAQPINSKYFDWKMYGIGSVDYKSDLLCWTTGEFLFCQVRGGNVVQMVGGADVITNGVCRGTDANHLMDISGVAIIKNHDDTQVIAFGCSPNTEEIKGVGLVTVSGDVREIRPLKAGDERLSAGSVVTVEALPDVCSYQPRPTVCVRLQRTTIPPPTTSVEVQPEPEATKDPEGKPEGPVIEDNGSKTENGKPVSGTDNGSGVCKVSQNWLLVLNTLIITTLALILS